MNQENIIIYILMVDDELKKNRKGRVFFKLNTHMIKIFFFKGRL